MALLGRTLLLRGAIAGTGSCGPRRVCVGVLSVAVLAVMPGGYGEVRPYSEHEVKAAYLHNFAKFVEWPEEKFPEEDTPIVVGLVCRDAFAEVFAATIKRKTVKGREIKLRRAKRVRDLADCHVVFIAAS